MKTILITGISSGIGKYLGEYFSQNNHLIGVSRTYVENTSFVHKVGNINEMEFLENLTKDIKTLDYLIINAGVGYFDAFENISAENNEEMIHTNLLSPILLSSLLIKKIQKGIIFIGSVSSKKSGKYGAVYSASKFGLRGFAMNLKNEYPKLSIHIINPKIIDTGFHKNAKIKIVGKYATTSLESICKTIENILEKKESKFEIDL